RRRGACLPDELALTVGNPLPRARVGDVNHRAVLVLEVGLAVSERDLVAGLQLREPRRQLLVREGERTFAGRRFPRCAWPRRSDGRPSSGRGRPRRGRATTERRALLLVPLLPALSPDRVVAGRNARCGSR